MIPTGRVGAVVNRISLVALPRVWPLPAANVRSPPALRVRLAKVRVVVPPGPDVV